MAWTHTFAFRCFREQFIDTYNQQNGADSGLSGGSGNDRLRTQFHRSKIWCQQLLKTAYGHSGFQIAVVQP